MLHIQISETRIYVSKFFFIQSNFFTLNSAFQMIWDIFQFVFRSLCHLLVYYKNKVYLFFMLIMNAYNENTSLIILNICRWGEGGKRFNMMF